MPKVYIGMPFSGGVNLFRAPHDIGEDEAARLKNLYPPEPGQLQTRPSTQVAFSLSHSTPVGQIMAMQFLPVNAPAAFAIITRSAGAIPGNSAVRAYASAASAPAALVEADLGAVTKYIPAMQPYQDKIYVFGGPGCSTSGKIIQKRIGGAVEIVDFVFTGANNAALRPSVVGIYRDRFVYGNFGPGFESAFVFADPFLPQTVGANIFTVNSSYGLVSPNDGDRIVAIAEVLRTGMSDVQSSCLMLKERSGYLLTGEPLLADGTTSPGTGIPELTTNRLPVDCGCSSQATLCYTPYGLIWAGPDDVWMFSEGQLPVRVGTKIRPALQYSPAGVRYRWHAVYHDGFYKLAIHADGQGPTDDDPCNEQWWLDLRSGPPQGWQDAKWYGPQVFTTAMWGDTVFHETGTQCMALDITPGANRDMYSGHETAAYPNFTHAIAAHGGNASHDSQRDGNDLNGIPFVTNQNTVIESEIITKELRNIVQGGNLVADGIMEKGFLGVEIDVDPSASGQLGWQWTLNSGRSIGAEKTAALDRQSGLILPGPLDSGVLSNEATALALDPAPARVVGRSIQLRLYNKSGYYINAENDRIQMLVEVATSVFVTAGADIPHGLYADRDTLAAAAATLLAPSLTGTGVTVTGYLNAGTGFINLAHSGTPLRLRFGFPYTGVTNASRVRTFFNLLGFTAWETGYSAGIVAATDAVYPKNTFCANITSGATVSLYTIPRRLL